MSSNQFRLISWNVAGRVRCCQEQIEALRRRSADIICLQEVRPSVLSVFLQGLRQAGFEYFSDNILLAVREKATDGQLIASRWPVQRLPWSAFKTPYPYSMLSVLVASPWRPIELHNTHIPPGVTHGAKKTKTFKGIFSRLARKSRRARILCGDFNSPQAEKSDGKTILWGEREDRHGNIVPRRGQRDWAAAERSVVVDLQDYDLPDVFRLLKGFGPGDFSFCIYRQRIIVSKRRFDHIFASRELNPLDCAYVQSFRTSGLSDHAAVEASFTP